MCSDPHQIIGVACSMMTELEKKNTQKNLCNLFALLIEKVVVCWSCSTPALLCTAILQTLEWISKLIQDVPYTHPRTHIDIHLAPSRCFVHRCLPRNPQVSVFSHRRVGEQNHWRRPLHPDIKQNTSGGKKCTENLSKRGRKGKKAKDFLIHPLLRWLVFGSAIFFMCEKPGL